MMNRLGRQSYFLVPTVLRGNPYVGTPWQDGYAFPRMTVGTSPVVRCAYHGNPTDVNQANMI